MNVKKQKPDKCEKEAEALRDGFLFLSFVCIGIGGLLAYLNREITNATYCMLIFAFLSAWYSSRICVLHSVENGYIVLKRRSKTISISLQRITHIEKNCTSLTDSDFWWIIKQDGFGKILISYTFPNDRNQDFLSLFKSVGLQIGAKE